MTPAAIDTVFLDLDLENNSEVVRLKIKVANLTADTIGIKWLRVVDEACDSWDIPIGDNNIHYFPAVSSNIQLDPDVNQPMYLDSLETYDFFQVEIYPRSNAACCEIKMHFSLADDPDNILATTVINANVNMDENCENEIPPLNTENAAELAPIKVFPNPTKDYFNLTTTEVFSSISLRNILGQEIINYSYSMDGQYNISNMPAGLYFIQLQDEVRGTLKLLPLTINDY